MGDGNRDEQRRADASPARDDSNGAAPFRKSGSGASYTPGGNWAAERGGSGESADAASGSMAGAPSNGGDGGFGPEGDYEGAGGQRAADVLGQVNGDSDPLIKEAQNRGPRKAERRFTGGEGVDAPDARD